MDIWLVYFCISLSINIMFYITLRLNLKYKNYYMALSASNEARYYKLYLEFEAYKKKYPAYTEILKSHFGCVDGKET